MYRWRSGCVAKLIFSEAWLMVHGGIIKCPVKFEDDASTTPVRRQVESIAIGRWFGWMDEFGMMKNQTMGLRYGTL